MASGTARLERHTLFVDDDVNDLGPLPPASNKASSWFPRSDGTTADTGLLTSHTAQSDQNTVQIPPLLESSTAETQARLDIPITFGSLWNKYKRIHKRDLGGSVVAVLKLPAEKDDYLVRKLAIAEDQVLPFRKRWLSHENICKTHEVFEDSGGFYGVMEPAVITLRHVCRCPGYPSEEQLVAITKQVSILHVTLVSR